MCVAAILGLSDLETHLPCKMLLKVSPCPLFIIIKKSNPVMFGRSDALAVKISNIILVAGY